jgi:plasmid stabilization system protein ParE
MVLRVDYEDDTDYRILVVGDFLVFYMVKEDGKIVEIHRIFHSTQDIGPHLNQNNKG